MENKFKSGDVVEMRRFGMFDPNRRVVGLVTPEGALLPLVLENVGSWQFGKASLAWEPSAFELAPDATLVQLGFKKPAPVETARVQVHGWYVVQGEGDLPQDKDRMVEWITAYELNRAKISQDAVTNGHVQQSAKALHNDYTAGDKIVLWRYADS